jgi:hypothetical protein
MIMGKSVYTIIFGLLSTAAVSMGAAEVFQSELTVGREKVRITLKRGRFDPAGHRFQRGESGRVLVDGVRAVGTDSFSPQQHLSEFRVEWNGRKIPISPKMFEFVFQPSLEEKRGSFDSDGSVFVLGSEAGNSVLLLISGGDGAGSFNSWWIITKGGHVDRFVDGPP